MATYEHQTNGAGIPPKITLYTNHMCPYAHRAHIALQELDLPYEEVLIDLESPRPDWYLKLNPRGLVPSMNFSNGVINDEIITESAVVTQFLADMRPSHLLPGSLATPHAPLFRARLSFFVDTWNAKCHPRLFSMIETESVEEKEKKCMEFVQVVEKEIEPLLATARPYFGGSTKLTLAEVQIAPFLLRAHALSKDGRYIPSALNDSLAKLPNFSKWMKAVMGEPSVTHIWDEAKVVARTSSRMERMKAQRAK